jgi:hypothetical protein
MATANPPAFFTLPSELIHQILTYLSLTDLVSVGLVNRTLHEHSLQDTLWRPYVQDHVPGTTLSKPANSTWRHLYIRHHPYWFIPANKIWFSNNQHVGKLLIARYNHRIDAIEAYALTAERRQPTFLTWDWNPDAIIHTFRPKVQLDLNAPVIRLNATAYENAIGDHGYLLMKEVPMDVYNDGPQATAGIYSRLMLTRPLPADIINSQTPLWPPLIVPSTERTRTESPSKFRDIHHRPSKLSELSTKTFRTRKWMEFSSRMTGVSMRVGEEVTTWATLPEECYRPTPLKPWQGIWCGDYAGHGCEFLAILQPDEPQPLPEKALWAMRTREREGSISSMDSYTTAPTETEENINAPADPPALVADQVTIATAAQETTEDGDVFSDPDCVARDELIYRGRIEAIKLTGDPNIPRGEYTFIAPDIGPDGLVRVATEEIFRGARIVKSVGHIAARGFRDGECHRSMRTAFCKWPIANRLQTTSWRPSSSSSRTIVSPSIGRRLDMSLSIKGLTSINLPRSLERFVVRVVAQADAWAGITE